MNGGEVKSILKDVLSDLKKKRKGIDFEKASAAWERIVGPGVSRHTKIVYLTKDRIRVNVDNSSSLYDLNLRKDRISKELKKAIKIEDIRFTLGEV